MRGLNPVIMGSWMVLMIRSYSCDFTKQNMVFFITWGLHSSQQKAPDPLMSFICCLLDGGKGNEKHI